MTLQLVSLLSEILMVFCRWFRTVEGDLLSETCGGNKEKGFDLTKNVY